MKRWLIVGLGVVVLAAAFLLLRPTDDAVQAGPDARVSDPVLAGGDSDSGPQLVVLVDGEAVQDVAVQSGPPLAHLPYSQLSSSMVSHMKGTGTFRTLVLIDGSEILLDAYTLQQLPADVVYRAGYDRTP